MKLIISAALLLAAVSTAQAASSYQFRIFQKGLQPVVVASPASSTIWSSAQRGMTINADSLSVKANGDTSQANWATVQGNTAHSTGKWYWETTFNSAANAWWLGIETALPTAANTTIGEQTGAYSFAGYVARLESAGTTYAEGLGYPPAGATIGVAVDLDGGNISFSVNCTYLSKSMPIAKGLPYYPGLSLPVANLGSGTANFGASAFKCPVPAGYTASW